MILPQPSISVSRRATVSSIAGMFSRMGLFLTSISFGYFADIYSLQVMYVIYGVVLLFVTLIIAYILLSARKKSLS